MGYALTMWIIFYAALAGQIEDAGVILPPPKVQPVPYAPTGTTAVKSPEWIPWIEVNKLDIPQITNARNGIAAWDRHGGKRIIVTTVPGRWQIMAAMRSAFTGNVIPGLKTTSLLPTLEDAQGWDKVASDVTSFLRACPPPAGAPGVFLFDNETAIKPYITGEKRANWWAFRDAIAQLPKNVGETTVEYWLVGTVGNGSEFRKQWFTEYVLAWECVFPNVRFLDPTRGMRHLEKSESSADCRARIGRVISKPMVPMLYVQDDARYWQPPDIRPVLRKMELEPDAVVIYPGFGNGSKWAADAERLGVEYEEKK